MVGGWIEALTVVCQLIHHDAGYDGSHRVNDLYAFCFLSRKWR